MPSRPFVVFFLMMLALALVAADSFAQNLKTTYAINGSQSTVTTAVTKASAEHEQLMRIFLFPTVAKKLRSLPNVTGVEFDNSIKGTVSGSSWTDYWEIKRVFPAIVHLSLPTTVTMMFKIEESFRKCKSPPEKAASDSDDAWSGSGSGVDIMVDCALQSSVKIKGPYAVYGNFASTVNFEKLLREKQNISIEVQRHCSDKTSMKIESRFTIESEFFDENLARFLEIFNVSLDVGSKSSARNQLLLGIARILRLQNERMVAL